MRKDNIIKNHYKASQDISGTKIYTVLDRFDAYTLNRFRKFILSPYFNQNERLVSFFDTIDPQLRNNNGINLTKGDIWEATYSERYDDTKFRKLCTDLLKLVEAFLAQEVYDSNPLHQANYLLQAVNQKKLEPLYNSTIRTAKRLSEQQFLKPSAFYYYQYEFEKNYYEITEFEVQRSEISNIELIITNLDKFYIAEKLRYYCNILSRRSIISHEYNILFIEHIIEHIESIDFEDIVPINFYYHIYCMLTREDAHPHYDQLKVLIFKHIQKIPENEKEEIIVAALNYCARQINQGNHEFLRERFKLYQDFVSNNLLLLNGVMTPWNFRNVIVTGLRLGEYDWVDQFIDNYKIHLEEKYRDNAVSFNKANLHFYKGEYYKVIEMLQTVEYEDISYNLNAKSMLIATYYELDEFEALQSLLETFRLYLQRNKKIAQDKKDHYLQLILFTKHLTRLDPRDTKQIQSLKKKIQNAKAVVNKNWLLEKIGELEG